MVFVMKADLTDAVPSPRSAEVACAALRVRVFRPGDGVVVVRVSGELDMSASHFLTEFLRQRLVGTSRMVVLDFSEISFINSEGVSALLEAERLAEARDKELLLVPAPVVDRVLTLLGLAGRFTYAAERELTATG
ncbi:STAS domain-containing protein [Saccharopolyspora sp. ID03-671]|uniref:STAS domain-containing protein n=1 Tax=Saccharopolyspora sp. ID03-671 TaxID=3073066 RepID=UPI00324A20AC